MADTVCALAAEFGYSNLFPTKEVEVPSKAPDTAFEIQAQLSPTESAKEVEACMTFASDLRTVRESLNKIIKCIEEREQCSHYLAIPTAEQEQTKNTLLDLSKIVRDSSIIALTEQRRNRLRELILKTTKNLENIARSNYDFCQQLEDISSSLTQ
ncbi:hypothetical protein TcWFU_004879 [Taenia crassiceps]|uniref:Mediator of RNA polymerase II transcription subunit 21 n=1 Tax=Taenia crassiceps TaxID=6207 RepID=A0ABR4Q9D4_9CEST